MKKTCYILSNCLYLRQNHRTAVSITQFFRQVHGAYWSCIHLHIFSLWNAAYGSEAVEKLRTKALLILFQRIEDLQTIGLSQWM